MRRKVFTITSAISLLLTVVTAVLWVSSRFRWSDLYAGKGRGSMWHCDSSAGELEVSHYRGWPGSRKFRYESGPPPNWAAVIPANSANIGPVYALNVIGGTHTRDWNWWFLHGSVGACRVVTTADGEVEWDAPIARLRSLESNRYSGLMPFWTVAIPYWLLVAAFALLPISAVARGALPPLLRLMSRRPGHCRRCDYDLTGNTSGVCPECGAAIVQTAPASPPRA